MSNFNPIIPARDLERLIDASHLHAEAAIVLRDAKDEAVQLKDLAKAKGRAEGLSDGCAAASDLIEDARSKMAAQTLELEDTLAQLVADTVRDIIGDADRNEMVIAAVRKALNKLNSSDTARLYVAQDMTGPVRSALSDVNNPLPVMVDEDLPDGVVLLSTEDGHAHIGLEAQMNSVLAAFEDSR